MTDRCGCTCGLIGCASQRKTGVHTHGEAGFNLGCRCDDCRNATNKESGARRKTRNSASLDKAHHHRQTWTDTELRIASDFSLTEGQVAERIGRTIRAVASMREKLHRGERVAPE